MSSNHPQFFIWGWDAEARLIKAQLISHFSDLLTMTINPSNPIMPQIPKTGIHYLYIPLDEFLAIPPNVQQKFREQFGVVFLKKSSSTADVLDFFSAVVLLPQSFDSVKTANCVVEVVACLRQDGNLSSLLVEDVVVLGHVNSNHFIKPPTQHNSSDHTSGKEYPQKQPTSPVSFQTSGIQINSMHVNGDFVAGNKTSISAGGDYINGNLTNIKTEGNSRLNVEAETVNIDQKTDGDQVNINRFYQSGETKINQQSNQDQVNINKVNLDRKNSDEYQQIETEPENMIVWEVKCELCGTVNPSQTKFCKECGGSLKEI